MAARLTVRTDRNRILLKAVALPAGGSTLRRPLRVRLL